MNLRNKGVAATPGAGRAAALESRLRGDDKNDRRVAAAAQREDGQFDLPNPATTASVLRAIPAEFARF